jgi:peptidoglycan/LPS O-acetylase OafA/YrhL
MAQQAQQAAQSRSARWGRFLPLDNGPQEIRALDGLRAVAALSVVIYHVMISTNVHVVFFGQNLDFLWFYLESGVDLFFVLSGFLLFMPYARAMLQARPLPSARRFYQRRALRILPAYWVCLAALVFVQLPAFHSKGGVEDILTHVVLLHDDFPDFNRTIEGPFWTLAVEAQFYVVLPLIALGIARIVGASRALGRLIAGVVGVLLLALALREADALLAERLHLLRGFPARALDLLLRAVTGTQGKYLEVFAIGMLCSVLYIAVTEGRIGTPARTRWAGLTLVLGSLVAYYTLAQEVVVKRNLILAPCYACMSPRDPQSVGGPFLIGLGYGALVLGVLLGVRFLRAPFEMGWLRFVGLISYSLYLWHSPLIFGAVPLFSGLPDAARVACTFAFAAFVVIPFAYLSYQLVERPFLRRRHRASETQARAARPVLVRYGPPPTDASPVLPTATVEAAAQLRD